MNVNYSASEAKISGVEALRVFGIEKRYANFTALGGVSLTAQQGEFVTLLGSSGSGKTTLLRIIAGLTDPTAGTVWIGGQDVTARPIEKRDIGFVFQNYALFPHLSVRDNITFSLKLRRQSAEKIRSRTQEMLDLVHLPAFSDRFASELSGGQQQRVAIARALAPAPKLLLLDEPMGALDRRLRQRLGTELRRIQRGTGVTAIYVTHDQEEAFLLSDRIAVLENGHIEQVGTPRDIYQEPGSLFIANFIGETCQLDGRVTGVRSHSVEVEVAGASVEATSVGLLRQDAQVTVVLRPEQIKLTRPRAPADPREDLVTFGTGCVRSSKFMGSRVRVSLQVGTVALEADLDPMVDPDWHEGDQAEVRWQRGAARAYAPGGRHPVTDEE